MTIAPVLNPLPTNFFLFTAQIYDHNPPTRSKSSLSSLVLELESVVNVYNPIEERPHEDKCEHIVLPGVQNF